MRTNTFVSVLGLASFVAAGNEQPANYGGGTPDSYGGHETPSEPMTYACNPAHDYGNGASCISTSGTLSLVYPSTTAPAEVTMTEFTTAFTTYCPSPTTFEHGNQTYTVTQATTITIQSCPGGCTETSSVPVAPTETSSVPVIPTETSSVPVVPTETTPIVPVVPTAPTESTTVPVVPTTPGTYPVSPVTESSTVPVVPVVPGVPTTPAVVSPPAPYYPVGNTSVPIPTGPTGTTAVPVPSGNATATTPGGPTQYTGAAFKIAQNGVAALALLAGAAFL